MVLVDTSVWVSHFREGNKQLESLLNEGEVVCHPFVIGELACGNLKNRSEILTLLQVLPPAKEATHDEVMEFVEEALAGLSLRPGHNTAMDRVQSATKSSDNHEKCGIKVRT